MALAGLRTDLFLSYADGHDLASMALLRRHELDAGLAELMDGPLHKGHHPLAGLLPCSEWPLGDVRTVLIRAEQGFRIGFMIAEP
jgi:hypothetical protein